MENNTETNQTEMCISCKKDTGVPVNKNVDMRTNYVEGAGQLCGECFLSLYNKIHNNDNDKTKP